MGLRLLVIGILFFLLYYIINRLYDFFTNKTSAEKTKEVFKITIFSFVLLLIMFIFHFNVFSVVYFFGVLSTYALSKIIKQSNFSQFIEIMSLLSWFGFFYSLIILLNEKIKRDILGILDVSGVGIKYRTKRLKKIKKKVKIW